MPTYTQIATANASGSSSTLSFTAIPSTYTDLVIKLSSRTNASNLTEAINVYFNSDTAANYSYIRLLGSGSGASSDTGGVFTNGNTTTSNTFGNLEIYIPNYTASTKKSMSVDIVTETNATTIYAALVAGLWTGTAAITRIDLTISGTFLTNSNAYLYGVSNA
jgi:hypothetical protein